MKQLEDAFKSISVILLIIAGSGIFMQVMSDGGVSIYIGQLLKDMQLSPLNIRLGDSRDYPRLHWLRYGCRSDDCWHHAACIGIKRRHSSRADGAFYRRRQP